MTLERCKISVLGEFEAESARDLLHDGRENPLV